MIQHHAKFGYNAVFVKPVIHVRIVLITIIELTVLWIIWELRWLLRLFLDIGKVVQCRQCTNYQPRYIIHRHI